MTRPTDRRSTMRKAYRRRQRQEDATVVAGCLFAFLYFAIPAAFLIAATWAIITLVLRST